MKSQGRSPRLGRNSRQRAVSVSDFQPSPAPAAAAIHPPLQALQDLLAVTPVGAGGDAGLTARGVAILHSPCVPLHPACDLQASHGSLDPAAAPSLPPGFSRSFAGMGQECLSFFLPIIALLKSADSRISLVCKHWPISLQILLLLHSSASLPTPRPTPLPLSAGGHHTHASLAVLLSVPSRFSRVRLFATLRSTGCQAPLSMDFSRHEYWSGLPCSPPGDLPVPGIEPVSPASPALAGVFFTTSIPWEAPSACSPPCFPFQRVLHAWGSGGRSGHSKPSNKWYLFCCGLHLAFPILSRRQ